MSTETKYPNLFKPIRIGSVVAKNRINFEPTAISCSNADGSVSELDIAVYSEIAKGGYSMINIGGCTPDSKTGRVTVTGLIIDEDNMIPAMARLAKSIQKYGALAIPQIQHPGRQCPMPKGSYYSTNDQVVKLPWSAGHEIVFANAEEKGKEIKALTTAQILDQVELWSLAAWRCQAAGFDAVCLHAAHGYLMSAFLSPYLNRRIDRFGGNFENRMRFPLAVIKEIKNKCGNDFPVIVRFSANEWVPEGIDVEESKRISVALEEGGADALDLSQCIQETPGAGFDPMQYQEGWTLYSAEAVKPLVKIPVIISHALRTPEFCEKIIADGKADMIGMCRGALADPYWPTKVLLGKENKIRKCISCLTGCWQESLMAKKDIACAINPVMGDLDFYKLDGTKASRSMKIAIVGGGPAGMEAARWAVLRGHKPTIFEKSNELGGAILGCCLVPDKDKMKWYADWLRYEIKDLGVEVLMEHVPNVEELKKFEVVLNATGAVSYIPDVNGLTERITSMEAAFSCPKATCEFYPKGSGRKGVKLGEKVIVWGDHYGAADLVAFLGAAGKDVTVVTDRKEFGSSVEVIHMYVLRKRMAQGDAEALHSKPYKYPVKVFESSTLYDIGEKEVKIIDKNLNITTIEADDIVTCYTRSNTELADTFAKVEAAGIPVVTVGDAKSPRNLHAAVKEGASFILYLDPDNCVKNPNGALLDDLPIDVKKQLGF
ncbi:MAG: FAD-dependent oxidoreductase [Actinobacteria bacterium]|nr:FAD-dependent oxidoreductase [Actinomycetota bacterium]